MYLFSLEFTFFILLSLSSSIQFTNQTDCSFFLSLIVSRRNRVDWICGLLVLISFSSLTSFNWWIYSLTSINFILRCTWNKILIHIDICVCRPLFSICLSILISMYPQRFSPFRYLFHMLYFRFNSPVYFVVRIFFNRWWLLFNPLDYMSLYAYQLL